MRVLIFHGYLLRGTGSNVFNASLAQALARLGHEVHLLCQDREPRDGRRSGRGGGLARVAASLAGSITPTPEIGGLLTGLRARPLRGFRGEDLRRVQRRRLDRYLDANLTAVPEVAESRGGVDAAVANHLVMSPVILARVGLDYALGPRLRPLLHGSARARPLRPLRAGGRSTAPPGSSSAPAHRRPPAARGRRPGDQRRRSASARPGSTPTCFTRSPVRRPGALGSPRAALGATAPRPASSRRAGHRGIETPSGGGRGDRAVRRGPRARA